MKDNDTYIDLIIAACKKVNEYISDADEAAFLETSIVQSAVMMQLKVIGEVSKKLSEESKNEIAVPWKLIIGLRDIISHDYFSLNLAIVWEIATIHIPELEKASLSYLEKKGTVYMPPFGDNTSLLD